MSSIASVILSEYFVKETQVEINISGVFGFLLLVAVATAAYARSKGRNPYLWGLLAFLPFTSPVAILVLFFLKPIEVGTTN